MTPVELIQHCSIALTQAGVAYGQGTLSAEDEAAWLVLWALNLPLDTDTASLVTPVSNTDTDTVLALLRQRIESRLPLAYLTGEAWLQGVSFHVDERCLIPRSLIAEVIAHGSMDPWLHPDSQRALDMCTGGGSLAVLLALAYPTLHVDALDISLPPRHGAPRPPLATNPPRPPPSPPLCPSASSGSMALTFFFRLLPSALR